MTAFAANVAQFIAEMFEDHLDILSYKIQLVDDVGTVQGTAQDIAITWNRTGNNVIGVLSPVETFIATSNWGDITDIKLSWSPTHTDYVILSLGATYAMSTNFELDIEQITITISTV